MSNKPKYLAGQKKLFSLCKKILSILLIHTGTFFGQKAKMPDRAVILGKAWKPEFWKFRPEKPDFWAPENSRKFGWNCRKYPKNWFFCKARSLIFSATKRPDFSSLKPRVSPKPDSQSPARPEAQNLTARSIPNWQGVGGENNHININFIYWPDFSACFFLRFNSHKPNFQACFASLLFTAWRLMHRTAMGPDCKSLPKRDIVVLMRKEKEREEKRKKWRKRKDERTKWNAQSKK